MFKDIYLQWFGDPDPGVPEIVYDEDPEAEEEIEVAVEGDEKKEKEEKEPEPKGKTREELEAEIATLKTQADSAAVLGQAVEKLGDKLQVPRSAAPAPTAVPSDDSAIQEAFNKDIFADDPYGVVKKLIQKEAKRIASEQVGQVAGAFAGTLVKSQKAIIKSDPKDGAIFAEYESEIEAEVQNLVAQNPAVKNNPELYQYAFDQVKTRNIDKIASKMAEDIAAKKAGVAEAKPKTQFSERSTGGAGPKTRTKKVVITKAEERYCDLRGLPITAFAKMKADGASFDTGGELIYG